MVFETESPDAQACVSWLCKNVVNPPYLLGRSAAYNTVVGQRWNRSRVAVAARILMRSSFGRLSPAHLQASQDHTRIDSWLCMVGFLRARDGVCRSRRS